MGGWFLSIAIGENFAGIFASAVSGETGMTTASALPGYTFGFWARRFGRSVVPGRAVDQQAHARREVASNARCGNGSAIHRPPPVHFDIR
jgi:hypothetical protein